MDGTTLTLAEWIALIGSLAAFIAVLLGNLDKIIGFFSKYIPKLAENREKKRQEEMEKNLNIVIPKILEKHTASQKGTCREEIANEVLEKTRKEIENSMSGLMNTLSEIKQINNQQNQHMQEIDKTVKNVDNRLEAVEEASKDQLRQRINEIYYDAKKTMTITASKKAELITLYRDYKRLFGNSYIDDRYNFIIKDCEVIPD